jgi:5-formyltetrahydrofolate cyclo-ligase
VAIPETPLKKRALRQRMRQLDPPDPMQADALRDHLATWIAGSPQFTVIAAFAALPDEPDLLPLFHRLRHCVWLLPRVDGHQLILHRLPEFPAFIPGPFGIREPSPEWPGQPANSVDLFLCPGLAFDPLGHRLGRGRGFYDRLLATARPDAVLAGVAFAARVVPEVPALDHDIRMHWLACEFGVRRSLATHG